MCYTFQGEFITKESETYESSRLLWNRAYNFKPKGIIFCKTVFDVCTAVNFVRSCNERFTVCCGGHHMIGACSMNDGYVINVSRLNDCIVDLRNCTITVGCGGRNRTLCGECDRNGYLFPSRDSLGGVCSWCLGGGIGNCCRHNGLGCDQLLEIEMVDYRGDIIIANDYCNRDLFWAVRGAGLCNFGIVTSLVFRLREQIQTITYFEVAISHSSRTNIIDFFDVWQNSISSFDWSMNCHAEISNTFHMGLCVRSYGISFLSVEQTRDQLRVFTSIRGLTITVEEKRYTSYLNQLERCYSPYEYYNATGRFVNQKYTISELEGITDIVYRRRPEGSIFTSIQLDGLGGAISSFDKSATSYYYRDASYLMTLKTQWFDSSFQRENNYWFDKKFDYIHDLTYGSYILEPYGKLKNYEVEYYGENVHMLREIKYRYDPYNLFRLDQGITI